MKKDNTNLNIEREFMMNGQKDTLRYWREMKMTSPEMRFITKELGSLEGKIVRLGMWSREASVYFAMKGADVTFVICHLKC